jgi:opacity protein-like surface antigen
MKSSTLVSTLAIALMTLSVSDPAFAQVSEIPRVEVSVLPGGAVAFTESDSGAPSFVSYGLLGTVTFNLSRYVGIEGEVGGHIGFDQDLDFPTGTRSAKPPHAASYSANVLVYPGGRDRRIVPYVIGGGGGLSLFEREDVGVDERTTFFTGNVGGGVKVDLSSSWGVRADYRFLTVASKDDAPSFFGRENRYGHRIAGGVVINLR